jgi:hypothetical protein
VKPVGGKNITPTPKGLNVLQTIIVYHQKENVWEHTGRFIIKLYLVQNTGNPTFQESMMRNCTNISRALSKIKNVNCIASMELKTTYIFFQTCILRYASVIM